MMPNSVVTLKVIKSSGDGLALVWHQVITLTNASLQLNDER